MKTARIYDVKTKSITEIPASELADGYIRVKVQGIDGEVFVEASTIKKNTQSHKHDFSEVMPMLRDLHKRLAEAYPVTWEQWIAGFQADQNPEQEIALWSFMTGQYEKAIEGRNFTAEQRKECFQVVLSAVSNGPEVALEVLTLNRITKEEAKEIIAGMPQ